MVQNWFKISLPRKRPIVQNEPVAHHLPGTVHFWSIFWSTQNFDPFFETVHFRSKTEILKISPEKYFEYFRIFVSRIFLKLIKLNSEKEKLWNEKFAKTFRTILRKPIEMENQMMILISYFRSMSIRLLTFSLIWDKGSLRNDHFKLFLTTIVFKGTVTSKTLTLVFVVENLTGKYLKWFTGT